MRIFTDQVVPWEAEPRQDLLSEREEDEAYLMAKEGAFYGVYFPKGSGAIGLDLRNFPGLYIIQWIDIGKGRVAMESEIDGGGVVSMATPYVGNYGWACAITMNN